MQEKYTPNTLEYALQNTYIRGIIKANMRYTKKQFDAQYPNDDACLDMVFQRRFGDLKHCPYCAAETKFYRVKSRQCYSCMHCGYQLFPLAGTIFRKTTTPLKDWFYAIYLFSTSKHGVSAKEVERHLGVTYKTAWRMCKQIRLLMQQDADKLAGTVEVDETYVGGKARMANKYANKTPVYGVTERGGSVKAVVARHGVNATTAIPFLRATVMEGSKVMSDESRIYNRVKRDFTHEFVTHSKEEYVRGNTHTNTIEGFWGQLKNSIRGTHHHVSPKYLQSYVNEFVFRYNLRDVAVCPVLLELAATRER
jgi:transposase-like protein